MELFQMIFYIAMAGIASELVVKLVRGHPAKWKDVKALLGRVDELEQRLGDTMTELVETRALLDDEMTLRVELAERLDFTERLLASGSGPREPPMP
jgi:hypothetical protein